MDPALSLETSGMPVHPGTDREVGLTPYRIRRLVATVVLALLLLGTYLVLKPFFTSIIWATILCVMTWPIFRRLRLRTGADGVWAALLMTLLLLVAVLVPVGTASWLLSEEVSGLVKKADAVLDNPPDPPAWLDRLPVVGQLAKNWLTTWKHDPAALRDLLSRHAGWLREVLLDTVSRLGRNLGKMALTLLTAYFFYRYGEELLEQTRTVTHRFTGERTQPWLQIVGGTIRAVVYGLLMTAVAQGSLAGLGYWIVGVPAPVILGVATGFLALIPFGAPLVWVPAGIWLLVNERLVPGVVLLAWGALVVSTIDNVLRPYFISGATKIPYLLVFFGVLGGIGAFGLVGVFIGPTILSVLLALWRTWASEQGSSADSVVVETRVGGERFVEEKA